MKFSIKNTVHHFPGKYGWYYIELEEEVSKDLRPILKDLWPGLLRASFSINKTTWKSSIMPIKDGPLFIALPMKVRKAEKINVDDIIQIELAILHR